MKRLVMLPLLLAMTLILAACPAAQTPAPAAPAATATPVPVQPTPEPEMDESAEMNIVETAIAAGNFTTLVAAVEAAGLVDALSGEGPFTVFAPTDEAFAALPAGTVEALLADPSGDLTQILLYHVISGQVMAADVTDGLEAETLQGSTVSFMVMADGVMINEANIIATDIETSNGVIHVIDAVILPPAEEETAAEATPEATEEAMAEMNIVETAIAAGNFTTLVAAVEAAGLVDALSGEGPFTVFAPTDEAFAALPAGTVEALLADPSGDLTQILLYHVISGQVMAADVTDGLEAETLQGSTVSFMVMAGGVMINEANIIATDIETSNGVIHVIDAVILPPAQ
jgi:transforming growth factor-beta-induced protein